MILETYLAGPRQSWRNGRDLDMALYSVLHCLVGFLLALLHSVVLGPDKAYTCTRNKQKKIKLENVTKPESSVKSEHFMAKNFGGKFSR